MNKRQPGIATGHRQVIDGVIHNRSISDPVITLARDLIPVISPAASDESAKIDSAIARASELCLEYNDSGDLALLAQAHFSLGICQLIINSGDDALESFQICAEMAESQNDCVTQAWALAFHGLTKRSLYELLQEDGRREIERARELFADENHQIGVKALEKRFHGMSN